MTQPAAGAGQAAAGIGATVDQLAAAIVVLYAAAEQQLLASLATIARRGLTDTAATAQVSMLLAMQRSAERVATALRLRNGPLTQRVAREAAQRGDAAALALLRRIVAGNPVLARIYLTPVPGLPGGGVAAANAIATDLANRLDATTWRITRYADDAYRAAVTEAATRLVLAREDLTPTTAQRLAWQELTRLGVTGYTDTAGRRWNLATYVETATRTTVQRAYNDAHDARMTAVGIDYFTVSHDGRPCPACKPWEGAVLGDQAGPATQPHAITGAPVTFTVKATLEEARAAGLQHPNCKHVLLPYFPGVTNTGPAGEWTAADEQRYAATQQLRALEREVRAGKREAAAALDDLARQRAQRRVRAAQARIRAHVNEHHLNRRRQREQLHLGNR